MTRIFDDKAVDQFYEVMQKAFDDCLQAKRQSKGLLKRISLSKQNRVSVERMPRPVDTKEEQYWWTVGEYMVGYMQAWTKVYDPNELLDRMLSGLRSDCAADYRLSLSSENHGPLHLYTIDFDCHEKNQFGQYASHRTKRVFSYSPENQWIQLHMLGTEMAYQEGIALLECLGNYLKNSSAIVAQLAEG